MKTLKKPIFAICLFTLFSILYVLIKFEDDKRIFEGEFKFDLVFKNDIYSTDANLLTYDVEKFLKEKKLKTRYRGELGGLFQIIATKKEIENEFFIIKSEMLKLNQKNYELTIDYNNNKINYLKNLVNRSNVYNSDKYFYSDIRKWMINDLMNKVEEKPTLIKEYYDFNNDYLLNYSINNLNFFSRSKSKAEIINVIITISVILILLAITLDKRKIV